MSGDHSEKISFTGFIAEALKTREIRNTIDSVITEIINQWEEGNSVKTIISNPVKWIVSKSFSKPEDNQQKNELLLLIKRLNMTKNIGDIIRSILESTDFGNLRRCADHSKEDIKSMIQDLNDLLVEFPGKLITGLSFIPLISNHVVYYLKDFIYRLNLLPADILTDILISIFKDIDAKTMGELINHVNELIRQVHTGSALIGEAGAPKFTSDLLEKMKTIQGEIDTSLLLKAGNALIDGKEVLQHTFNTLLNNDPELLKDHLQHLILSYNSKISMMKQKLELIDSLNEDDDAETLTSVISEINGGDLAETINTACFILNAVQENAPKTIQKIISDFINTLDLDEIESALETLLIENDDLFKPLVRATFPVIVNGLIARLLSKNDDDNEKIENTKNKLRQFIMGEE
jgi:hypothetical protein